MDTKYDWAKAPSWVNWIFTCSDGEVWGTDNKPCSIDGFHGEQKDRWDFLWNTTDVENWKDSLEQRPKEHSHD